MPLFEGQELATGDVNGTVRTAAFERISVQFSLSADAIVERGITAYVEALCTAAEEHRQQLTQLLYERVSEVTAETGNVIDAKGKPFSKDLWF